MTLIDEASASTTVGARPSAIVAAAGERTSRGTRVSVVLPDPGTASRAAQVLDELPAETDEVILVRGPASAGALQRAGFAAARNACMVVAGPGADLSALNAFVAALLGGAATAALEQV